MKVLIAFIKANLHCLYHLFKFNFIEDHRVTTMQSFRKTDYLYIGCICGIDYLERKPFVDPYPYKPMKIIKKLEDLYVNRKQLKILIEMVKIDTIKMTKEQYDEHCSKFYYHLNKVFFQYDNKTIISLEIGYQLSLHDIKGVKKENFTYEQFKKKKSFLDKSITFYTNKKGDEFMIRQNERPFL